MRCRVNTAGFTLIELMIAMSIMALALYLVSPSLTSLSERSLITASANKIANTLRRARAEAISRNAQSVVAFDLRSRRYWRSNGRDESTIDHRISLTVKSLTRETHSQTRTQIRFFPDGSSTGGMVRLKMGGKSVRMDVDWLTGHVIMRKVL